METPLFFLSLLHVIYIYGLFYAVLQQCKIMKGPIENKGPIEINVVFSVQRFAGSIPKEDTQTTVKNTCIAFCKWLWMKTSAKCVNVWHNTWNVSHEAYRIFIYWQHLVTIHFHCIEKNYTFPFVSLVEKPDSILLKATTSSSFTAVVFLYSGDTVSTVSLCSPPWFIPASDWTRSRFCSDNHLDQWKWQIICPTFL